MDFVITQSATSKAKSKDEQRMSAIKEIHTNKLYSKPQT